MLGCSLVVEWAGLWTPARQGFLAGQSLLGLRSLFSSLSSRQRAFPGCLLAKAPENRAGDWGKVMYSQTRGPWDLLLTLSLAGTSPLWTGTEG